MKPTAARAQDGQLVRMRAIRCPSGGKALAPAGATGDANGQFVRQWQLLSWWLLKVEQFPLAASTAAAALLALAKDVEPRVCRHVPAAARPRYNTRATGFIQAGRLPGTAHVRASARARSAAESNA